jgi:hypothetical protein
MVNSYDMGYRPVQYLFTSIAIKMTGPPENIVILLKYFEWWPYLF